MSDIHPDLAAAIKETVHSCFSHLAVHKETIFAGFVSLGSAQHYASLVADIDIYERDLAHDLGGESYLVWRKVA